MNPLENNLTSSDDTEVELVPALPGRTENDGSTADALTANGSSDVVNDPTDDPVLDTPPVEPDPPSEVGRLMSKDQLVIFQDVDSQSWQRVPSGTPLMPGTHLSSLPMFRPRILMSNGARLTLVGATDVELVDTGK